MVSYNLACTYCTHFISSYTESHIISGIIDFCSICCFGVVVFFAMIPLGCVLPLGMFFYSCLSKFNPSFHAQFQCHLLSEDFPDCP